MWRKLFRRLSGRRDHLDGIRDGVLCGWALPKAGSGPVPVVLYDERGRVAETLACQFRADLRDAGLADGRCGFRFSVPQGAAYLRACRLDGPRPREIGRITLDARDQSTLPLPPPRGASLQDLMQPGVTALRAPPTEVADTPAKLSRRQAQLFAETAPGTQDPLPAPLCAYPAFLRQRHKMEAQFNWDTNPDDVAHVLNWILTCYAPMRAPLRPPLSRDVISWLNTDVLTPGQSVHLSRATWAAVMEMPVLRENMDFANPDWVDQVIYWWAVDYAPAIQGEDCLVTDSYRRHLAGLAEGQLGQAFPLTRYLLRWVTETPELAHLSTTTKADRRQIMLAALVRAAERPDTLRYLPRACIETLLTADARGQTPLGAYLTTLDGQSRLVSRADYAACLRARGYDMETGRFLNRTEEGHRLHSAALPARAQGTPVDVQVIGPVTKASGLGQAMRASIAALKTTDLSVQVVNFDLDNPAPEIDVPHTPITAARPARFTLLHLNAETIPLLYAYAPDITEGSYCAAYMFWELTQPAACHALALRMMDEIWAASEHGKAIYADAFHGPIRVMGLASDVGPPEDPLGARAAFVAQTGFDAENFLCMASFDSFSFIARKNPLGLIRAFDAAFPQGGAQLLLKTQNRARVSDPAQKAIWAEIDTRIAGDARFLLRDETIGHEALLALKAGADAYLSLHRAEGWGFGAIEAMALGVPVLATGYSGTLAYAEGSTAWLVPAREVAPNPEDYMFTPKGGLWAEPDHTAAARLLRQMQADPALRHRKAHIAQTHVQRAFAPEVVGRRYATRIETVLRQTETRAA